MEQSSETITWYHIFKDIIIPALGVLSTVTIGIIIAIILKRREEKAKIKTLLIDNYMQYLNRRSKFADFESDSYTYEIFKDIYINYTDYFENHANIHMPLDEIKVIRDNLKSKVEAVDDEDINWSLYTFKFCFLLGTKTYRKKAQFLETVIIDNLVANASREKLLNELKEKIRTDASIQENMKEAHLSKIKHGIDLIRQLISKEYNEFQLRLFRPYDSEIANLIDK